MKIRASSNLRRDVGLGPTDRRVDHEGPLRPGYNGLNRYPATAPAGDRVVRRAAPLPYLTVVWKGPHYLSHDDSMARSVHAATSSNLI